VRSLGSAARPVLYRPLVEDDAPVPYWIRRVRNGVVHSEISPLAVAW
jgi:hypothetical protein